VTPRPSDLSSHNLPPRFAAAIIVVGITSLIAQVVLTRELLSLFLGNELSIAFVLAIWLAAVAGGSALAARFAARFRNPETTLAWTQIGLAVLLPASLFIARSIRLSGIIPGEAFGPGAVLLASCETLVPVCLLVGAQFVLSAAAASKRLRSVVPTTGLASVYALESLGAVIGGLAFHLILSQQADAYRIFAITAILNLISSATLLQPSLRNRSSGIILPHLAFGLASIVLLAIAPKIDLASTQESPRWSGYTVLAHTPSKYGDITVAERAGQLSLLQSGILSFTTESHYENEISAHLPLLSHPSPRHVLIIGGAFDDLAEAALQHSLDQLDCVELDPKLWTEAARAAHRLGVPSPVPDFPRVNLIFGDARNVVRRTSNEYDVIILNLPDPTTAALNRFYTVDFFREASRALAPGGILATSLTGSSHHLSGPVLLAAATLERTLRQVFPDVLLVPGDQMVFVAATTKESLSKSATVLSRRLQERSITTDFVNDAWLRDALLPFRADLIQAQIDHVGLAPVNTDLNPVGYYHQLRVWLDQLSPRLAAPMQGLSGIRVWWAIIPFPIALILLLLPPSRRPRFRSWSILLAIAMIGGFGMIVEIVGLLVFQAALGYLYHALGVLIATFMAGLAAGAAMVRSRRFDEPTAARFLIAALLTAAVTSAVLPGILEALLAVPQTATLTIATIFFLAGSLVGGVFPFAAALYRRQQPIESAGGIIYAADLIGSAGAAVFAGAIAVPLLGITGVAHLTALLILTPLILALPLLRT